MATSETTTLRNAIVTILSADATIRQLCGRTTGLVVLWGSIANAQRPVIAYQLSSSTRTGGAGHRRRVQVMLAAFASGNGAQDKTEALMRRARELLTNPALKASGIDATVIAADERSGNETEAGSVSQESRHDCDFMILLTAPS